MNTLYTAVREPRQPQSERSPLLILLHGYGSDEEDLLGLADHLDPRFHVLSVRAPLPLETGGNAWFPIEFTEAGLSVDYEAGDRALEQLGKLLSSLQENLGNDGSDTFVLGFSQGGAMALGLMMSRPDDIGGVAFLSGLWSEERMPEAAARAGLQGKPVLQTHGVDDPLIPIAAAHASRDLFQQLGVELTYREYHMGHQIDADCLREIRDWLTARIDDQETDS